MRQVQAQELLDDPDHTSRLNMEGLERLLLRAGHDPEVAHEVAMQRGWDRLATGQPL